MKVGIEMQAENPSSRESSHRAGVSVQPEWREGQFCWQACSKTEDPSKCLTSIGGMNHDVLASKPL
jgi:hypothetical protein